MGAEDWDWKSIWKSIDIMSAVILSVVCVLGVVGNGVVIWATGFRMEKTVSTVWYLNLAVADFLVTAFLPLQITYNALEEHWPFGWFMCKMDGLVLYMNMYASIFTLVVISVDRCVGVVCPLWARCSGHRTVRKASWVSLGVWVLASAPSIPYVISRDTETYGDEVWCFGGYASITTGSITNVVVGFVVPFSVIVSCYSVIIYRLRNNRPLAGQSGRSFKVIATVIAAFFLCWIPFHIIRLIDLCHVTGLIEFSDTLYGVILFGLPITLALALLNSCLNPLVYVFSQGFKDVFRCRSVLKVLEKAFAEEPPQNNNTPPDPDVTSPETEEPPQANNTRPDPDVTSPETVEPPQTNNTPPDPDVTSPETAEPSQANNTPPDPDVTSPETVEPPQTNNTPPDPDVTSPETAEPSQANNTPPDPDVTSPETVEPPQTNNTPPDPDVTSPETVEPSQTNNTPPDPDVTSPETVEPSQANNTPPGPDVTSPETVEPSQTNNTPPDPDVTSPETVEPSQANNTPPDPDVTSPETEEPPQTNNTPPDPDVTSPETVEPSQANNTPPDPDVTSPETVEPSQANNTPPGPDVTSPETVEPPQTNNTPPDPEISLSETEGSTVPPGTQNLSGDSDLSETLV